MSNIEAGKNYALRAHVMLKCAQQIAELYNEIEFLIKTNGVTPEIFKDRLKRYDKIISDFSDNHDDIDFLSFQVDHWKHFKLSGFSAYFKTFRRRLQRWLSTWGYYMVMLLPPPIMLIYILSKSPLWIQ